MENTPFLTWEEVEKLLVDLMMNEWLEGFRWVQRMCCEAMLTGLDKNVLVKAVMGSRKDAGHGGEHSD
jgi:hypothetical protein